MKRALAVVLTLLLVLLTWWALTPPEKRVVRPSQTLRALESRLKRKPPPLPKPAPVPVVETPPIEDLKLTHDVDLDDGWTASMGSMDEWFIQTLPESYWPHLDEVDWPDNPSVEALQGLVDQQIEAKIRETMPIFSEPGPEFLEANRKLEDVLDLAEEEGLLADTPIWDRPPADDTDPWALLHQAQVHRSAELHAYLHSDEDGGLRPAQAELKAGLPETDWLASRIADQYGDHPAADFARLMLLETSQWELSGENSDPQLAVDDVVAAVTQTQDPMVKETALIGLLGHDAERLEGADTTELLAVLEEELDTLPTEVQDALSAQALEIAIRTAPDKVGTWLEQVEKADTTGDEPVIDPRELDEIWDDLAARGLREPNSWSSEIHAHAWACHRKHPLDPPVIFEVVGNWDGGWNWEEPRSLGRNREPIPMPESWWACFEGAAWEHEPTGKHLTLAVHNVPFLAE